MTEIPVRRATGATSIWPWLGLFLLLAVGLLIWVVSDDETKATNRFQEDRLVVEEHIFFAYASAALTPTGRAKLDDIASELKAAGPWQLLRVNGHSDRLGPKDYNRELSRDRAAAVEGYLATLGVKDDKLDIKAYGESRPLENDASSHEQYQRNRRVEFTIVRAR
jgi:outer membrane protein OmpA-like peptidoglycan-associated protein